MTCTICKGVRYLVCERDDGTSAVERCDTCSDKFWSDEEAAKQAQLDGINCAPKYPCVINNHVADHIDGYDRDDLGESPDY